MSKFCASETGAPHFLLHKGFFQAIVSATLNSILKILALFCEYL